MTTLLRWDDAAGAWRPAPAAAPSTDPLAADSWLVDDGRIRRLDLHRARFIDACAREGAGPRAARAAAALGAVLPGTGRWFPRVDLWPGGEIRLTIRPGPPRSSTVIAWICPDPDPRRTPRRKGPELRVLGALRDRAAEHGAGEGVLVDRDGRLLEGAYSSLLWWEDDRMCALPDNAPVLPGVTRRLLLELAEEAGVVVTRRRPLPPELAGREAWLVSALHGIRTVSAWADGGPPAGAALRAPGWQRRLDALATPA